MPDVPNAVRLVPLLASGWYGAVAHVTMDSWQPVDHRLMQEGLIRTADPKTSFLLKEARLFAGSDVWSTEMFGLLVPGQKQDIWMCGCAPFVRQPTDGF